MILAIHQQRTRAMWRDPELSVDVQYSNAVVVAVTDVDSADGIDKHPVRSIKSAFQCDSFGAITPVSVTHNRFDGTGRDPDDADGVAFGVCEVNVSVGSQSNSLWSG